MKHTHENGQADSNGLERRKKRKTSTGSALVGETTAESVPNDTLDAATSQTPTAINFSNMSPENQHFFEVLHEDVWLYLMNHFLSPFEICALSGVCKQFYMLASNAQVQYFTCTPLFFSSLSPFAPHPSQTHALLANEPLVTFTRRVTRFLLVLIIPPHDYALSHYATLCACSSFALHSKRHCVFFCFADMEIIM